MKITDKSVVHQAALARGVAAAAAPGARAAGRAGSVSADSVRVSDLARALSTLLGGIDANKPDPARAALVAVLRNAVASGRYAPDLEAVARNLLTEAAAELAG
jgi:flagellar biosynthesis anti-sigma factor FlgM